MNRFSVNVLVVLVFLLALTFTSSKVTAQSAQSNCVRTVIGTPPAGPSPTYPPNCLEAGGSGQYPMPVDINVVTGVASEMASYGGDFSNCMTSDGTCHREHAGLDISTPVDAHVPVSVVADGTITAVRDTCSSADTGQLCRIDFTHDGDNLISSYTHVDKLPAIVEGMHLTKGTQIAVVHSWGIDHLHFELQKKNTPDNDGIDININPRNYLPQLQRFPPSGYGGNTGADVRVFTNSSGLPWANDGKEYGETFLNHPPCANEPSAGWCWAH